MFQVSTKWMIVSTLLFTVDLTTPIIMLTDYMNNQNLLITTLNINSKRLFTYYQHFHSQSFPGWPKLLSKNDQYKIRNKKSHNLWIFKKNLAARRSRDNPWIVRIRKNDFRTSSISFWKRNFWIFFFLYNIKLILTHK